MTVCIVSDLHCWGSELPRKFDVESLPKADVLAVAGDIATGNTRAKYIEILTEAVKDKFKNIVITLGNHDYYETGYYTVDAGTKPPSVEDNFVTSIEEKLEGDRTRVVDFICTPMWSPIKHDRIIRYALNDYNYIIDFTTKRCTALFKENLEWLESKVKESREQMHDIVIMTHHLPRHELISDMYMGDTVNEAFCVINKSAEKRLNALAPKLWIHGHSHNFLDVTIDGTRYVRNPTGYDYPTRIENTGYINGFTVEV